MSGLPDLQALFGFSWQIDGEWQAKLNAIC
jgi:hypothetical protein